MEVSHTAFLPPISFNDVASSAMTEEICRPERSVPHSSGVTLDQARDCRSVEMIVMVVGKYDPSIGAVDRTLSRAKPNVEDRQTAQARRARSKRDRSGC